MKGKRLFLSLLILWLSIQGVFALSAEYASQPLPQDPNLLCGRLSNGLKYYIIANKQPANRAEMRLFVNAGSVNEDDDQRGLAHFTEHMAFNGTKSFAKNQVVDYLSSIGMGFMNGLNGMTSYDFTVYMFKVPTDNQEQLSKGMLILSEMASAVSFDPAEIERERGIIIEEWRMGQGASERISSAQNKVLFAGSKYAERSPIGTYEVLSTFTPATIKRFYKDWYHPENQSVVIVGDFDPQEMLALVTQHFGSIPKNDSPRVAPRHIIPENTEPQVVVAKDKEFPYTVMQVIWKKDVTPMRTVGDFYQELKSQLFFDMLNARLNEITRKPNPPFSMAMGFDQPQLKTMGGAMIYALLAPNKGEEALQAILTEAERVQRFGFSTSEFDRAKVNVLRRMERQVAQNDTRESEGITWGLLSTLLHGTAYISASQEDLLARSLIEEIALNDVNTLVANLIPDKNMFVSIAGPDTDKAVYPTEERIREIIASVTSADMDDYDDKVIDQPIMAQKPKPGSIRKQVNIRRSGISKITLSNGIVVYLKKTDFKKDEIILSGFSRGGFAQLGPELITAGNTLSWYISESGFGQFDAVSLDKATVGKVASAGLTLSLNQEGISASCSPQDMELMFQMLHQYATQPRFEQDDFASFLSKAKAMMENDSLDPENVFSNTLDIELFSNNPYAIPTQAADLDNLTLDQLRQVWADRFANFGDFTFIVAGNFDEAALKTMLRTYVATLPATKVKDAIRDVGIRPLQGQKEVRFRKGVDERCFAAHITSGPLNADIKTRAELNAMSMVLNEKLRENIREDRSGVYVIGAWPSIERYPAPSYRFTIYMACSPERVDELNEAIFATIDSLRAGQYDDKYVASAKITLQKRHEESIRRNRWWVDGIQSAIWFNRPEDQFMQYPAIYEAIDRNAITAAACRYLNFERNKLTVIMLPEKAAE